MRYLVGMNDEDFVRSLGPAFLPHMLRRLSDLMVDGGTEWTKQNPAMPPLRTHSTMFALEQNGQLSVTQLAALLRQSHPLVLQWVGALEKRGLVERHCDPQDRRRTMLRLTANGASVMPAIHHARAVNEQVTRCLTQELGDDLWERLRRAEALLRERPYIVRMTSAASAVGEEAA
jgi:DNA-binding MarR family transcriptional regulator